MNLLEDRLFASKCSILQSILVPAAVLAEGSLTEDERAVLREINRVMNSDYSKQPCPKHNARSGRGGPHKTKNKLKGSTRNTSPKIRMNPSCCLVFFLKSGGGVYTRQHGRPRHNLCLFFMEPSRYFVIFEHYFSNSGFFMNKEGGWGQATPDHAYVQASF